ncbi:MAG TPA: iron-containing redox enzyme family protein [Terriglobia bacterium]|nr:iron-containing redox enzyme family protein [Terriglobia bacterium]
MPRALRHSERLNGKIELVISGLNGASLNFWRHPRVCELYPELLFNIHCVIRASVPLMETARRAALDRAGSDAVAALVAAYLERHIPEEMHHDEWLLNDLRVLGKDPAEVLMRVPPVTAAALVGSQYYWALHAHPVAIMAYLAVLEGNPPSAPFLEEVIATTGLPREAFRTYLKHALLDPHHGAELNTTLDAMPLSEQHAVLLGVNAFQTVASLQAMFRELAEQAAAQPAGVR